MPQKNPPKIEQDYQIFFIFMTLVMGGVYILSMVQNPALQRPWLSVIFTALMILHIVLHWNVNAIIQTPQRKAIYVLGQGVLAFIITQISNNTGMVFALYMALIGETIGFLGITRWGILSTLYYLSLSLINFVQFSNISNAVYWLFTIIPVVIFVSMYVTLYLRQAEAREKAQAIADQLEAANRQLTEYAAQVEDLTIANERQRLARELHDTLSQGLAGLILQLEAADAHLNNHRNDKAQSIINSAMAQARATLAAARRAIDDLRQPTLDDLDSAMRLETDRFTNSTGIPVRYQADPTPPLPDATKEALIRAVAESLANIAHHAQAHNVDVKVDAHDHSLSITIQDDGQGFDPSAIPAGHYGLLGIKERIRLIHGQVEIHSENGKGSLVKIHAPFSPFPAGDGQDDAP